MLGKSKILWRVVVSGFRLELWESRSSTPYAYNYTLAFSIVSQPDRLCIRYLGADPDEAVALFMHKVELHRRLSA